MDADNGCTKQNAEAENQDASATEATRWAGVQQAPFQLAENVSSVIRG
jgi:hypothetical protein